MSTLVSEEDGDDWLELGFTKIIQALNAMKGCKGGSSTPPIVRQSPAEARNNWSLKEVF